MSISHISRRDFLSLSGLAAAGLTLASCAPGSMPRTAATVEPPVSNADEALGRLKEGNQRYAANRTVDPNQTAARRAEVAQGQKPFATILGCVDSRVPAEIIFDRGLGDLFVVRTAGQVIDGAVMGSVEFGALELGIPLILVLGHEKCGAVNATIEAIEKNVHPEGSIGVLVDGIKPAVEGVRDQPGDLLDNAVKANVELGVRRLKESPILADLLKEGRVKIVGGHYDLDTGEVQITVL
jgi:carbonic anhydrase